MDVLTAELNAQSQQAPISVICINKDNNDEDVDYDRFVVLVFVRACFFFVVVIVAVVVCHFRHLLSLISVRLVSFRFQWFRVTSYFFLSIKLSLVDLTAKLTLTHSCSPPTEST